MRYLESHIQDYLKKPVYPVYIDSGGTWPKNSLKIKKANKIINKHFTFSSFDKRLIKIFADLNIILKLYYPKDLNEIFDFEIDFGIKYEKLFFNVQYVPG